MISVDSHVTIKVTVDEILSNSTTMSLIKSQVMFDKSRQHKQRSLQAVLHWGQ